VLHKHLAVLSQLDPDRAQPETGGPRPEQVALASGQPVLVVCARANRRKDVAASVHHLWDPELR